MFKKAATGGFAQPATEPQPQVAQPAVSTQKKVGPQVARRPAPVDALLPAVQQLLNPQRGAQQQVGAYGGFGMSPILAALRNRLGKV